ncbi:MAG TPA: DedA family protein, partial [Mycobacterium sp.]|nr:DedA family protein [Mycobacterium sp.]
MNVEAILETIPPLAVYLMVGLVIGLESLGIPLPGEIVLVSAALLSSRHTLDISPVWVGVSATIGAIIGDTIGYTIGRRFGMSLFERLGKRFPKHFGTGHVALAKQLFTRWGV